MADDKKPLTTTKEDVEKNKVMAIVAYFIFFVPLLTDAKDSKFVKFHVNQAFLVFLMYVAAMFFSFFLIGFILYPVAFVFWILGLVSAINGEMKRLPIFGSVELIK